MEVGFQHCQKIPETAGFVQSISSLSEALGFVNNEWFSASRNPLLTDPSSIFSSCDLISTSYLLIVLSFLILDHPYLSLS
jgi:hypothetical protein